MKAGACPQYMLLALPQHRSSSHWVSGKSTSYVSSSVSSREQGRTSFPVKAIFSIETVSYWSIPGTTGVLQSFLDASRSCTVFHLWGKTCNTWERRRAGKVLQGQRYNLLSLSPLKADFCISRLQSIEENKELIHSARFLLQPIKLSHSANKWRRTWMGHVSVSLSKKPSVMNESGGDADRPEQVSCVDFLLNRLINPFMK